MINSDPRRRRPDVQLKMEMRDFPNLLKHDSYLDAGLPRYVSPAELDNRLKTDSWRDKGQLKQRDILRILTLVDGSKYLSEDQRGAISIALRGVFGD